MGVHVLSAADTRGVGRRLRLAQRLGRAAQQVEDVAVQPRRHRATCRFQFRQHTVWTAPPTTNGSTFLAGW
eukprot:6200395-Pleurochrysis_carterae.AAC.2